MSLVRHQQNKWITADIVLTQPSIAIRMALVALRFLCLASAPSDSLSRPCVQVGLGREWHTKGSDTWHHPSWRILPHSTTLVEEVRSQ